MNQKNPTLRVQVVLYRNSSEELGRAFEALVNSLQQARNEISSWVVTFGDSSPAPVFDDDRVAAFALEAQNAGGSFTYEFFDANLGHGGGHNRLHESAQEDLLLILNPDGILAPNTVSALVAALEPGVGIVDARQLPLEHPKEYDTVTGEASWSSLACGLTRAEVFREVGGIDHETFFMYCDDVDYSWRVRLAGYSAKYCPSARMFHDKRLDHRGQIIAGEVEQYYSAEAALLLAYKYSRDDVVATLERAMADSSDANLRRALAEFHRRRQAGLLPTQIDTNRKVADFTQGSYGAHRF